MIKPTSELKSVTKKHPYVVINILPSTRERLLKHYTITDTWDSTINKVLDKAEGEKGEVTETPVP